MDERRKQYRIDVSESELLEATVLVAGLQSFKGKVLDASAGGVAVVFGRTGAPLLLPGQRVELQFSIPGLTRLVSLSADVKNEHVKEDHVRYGFQLTNLKDLESQMPSAFWSVFNRRSAARLAFGVDSQVAVSLVRAGLHVQAVAHDLSATGICVRISDQELAAFAADDRLAVSLMLPGQWSELHLESTIRNCRSSDEGTLLGLAFDAERSERFEEQQEVILDYLAEYMVEYGERHTR